jgi:hypothetical protein
LSAGSAAWLTKGKTAAINQVTNKDAAQRLMALLLGSGIPENKSSEVAEQS